jgi:hypothetical protein
MKYVGLGFQPLSAALGENSPFVMETQGKSWAVPFYELKNPERKHFFHFKARGSFRTFTLTSYRNSLDFTTLHI